MSLFFIPFNRFRLLAILFAVSLYTNAQPFVDILSISNQQFSSSIPQNSSLKFGTSDYFVNVFVPKEFKNGNTLLIRAAYEDITCKPIPAVSPASLRFKAVSAPIGFQFLSKNKKWKSVFLAIPKLSSDFKSTSTDNFQMGAVSIFTYVKNDSLKFKFGLYYNKEFFGNFFVPLVGVDWKINSRFSLYGILPTSYKAEYKLSKNLYTGLNFRSFTRSYRFSDGSNANYLRLAENQLKLFLDIYIKKFVVFIEGGASLGFTTSLNEDINYQSQPNYPYTSLFSKYKDNFVFNMGLAYRIRFDRTQK